MEMGFSYPRASNWVLCTRQQGGKYYLLDCLEGKQYTLGRQVGYLWKRLDGKTAPEDILPHCPRAQMETMLEDLDKYKLIRHDRVLEKSEGSISWSLIIPQGKTKGGFLPMLFNSLLLFLWCPLLVLGIYSFLERFYLFDDNLWLLGQLVGVLVGCVLHELAHACAGLSYGANLLEAGVFLKHWLPGGYVLLYDDAVKGLPKVQIYASGVEMNFLLTGVGLLLATAFPGMYGFFFGFALNNCLIGLLNLSFIEGLDGMHILEILLGYEPLQAIRNKKLCKKLKKQGLPGI